jgi:hypothetical protein
MKLKAALKLARSGLIKYAPQIATGVGLGLALVAGVRAVQKTPEAVKLIERKKEEKKDELTVTETVKTVWKCYLPSVIIFIVACVLIIGGQRISTRRAVAAATACSLYETQLKQYQEAAKEVLGDKKEAEIRTQMARNEVTSRPPLSTDDIVSTGRGNALFFDELSKRYFWSDPAYVDKIFQNLNFQLLDEMYVSLNDYWDALGLPTTNPGNLICWCVNDGKIDPSFDVILVASGPYEGYPCKVIGFYCEPEYSYKDRT